MWTRVILVVIFAADVAQSACPSSCSCSGSTVTCSGLSYIPEDIPKDTTDLILTNMALSEISSDGFVGFGNLTTLKILNSYVQAIRPYAFFGLNATEILFTGCHIGRMDSKAFSQLEWLRSLGFKNCTIQRIASLAVSDIGILNHLEFSLSTVTEFQPWGVSNVRHVGMLAISGCNIPSIGAIAFSSFGYVGVILISSSQIGTIDSFAFSNVTEAGQILVTLSSILEIKSQAFSQFGRVRMFGISQSNITAFRYKAISNNTISLLSFVSSKIDRLESYAVSDNSGVYSLFFNNMYVIHMESFAFNDNAIKRGVISSSTIKRLDHGTIEHLSDTVEDSFNVALVNLTCDGNICWVFHPKRTQYLQTTFSDVHCAVPQWNLTSGLGSLVGVPLEKLPFGCNKCNYTASFTQCSSSSRTPGRWAPVLAVVLTLSLMALACSR